MRTGLTCGGGWVPLLPNRNLVGHVAPPAVANSCLFATMLLFSCFYNAYCSFRPAEKEHAITVKQEPVELKEPVIEADKIKSRYKKNLPPVPLVPPSPVSGYTVLPLKASVRSVYRMHAYKPPRVTQNTQKPIHNHQRLFIHSKSICA